MPDPAAKFSKITIRQPVHLKRKVAQAASRRGMTVTSFINGALERAAERTLEQVETRELSEKAQHALLAMLRKPGGPNKRLVNAARRYRERYGS